MYIGEKWCLIDWRVLIMTFGVPWALCTHSDIQPTLIANRIKPANAKWKITHTLTEQYTFLIWVRNYEKKAAHSLTSKAKKKSTYWRRCADAIARSEQIKKVTHSKIEWGEKQDRSATPNLVYRLYLLCILFLALPFSCCAFFSPLNTKYLIWLGVRGVASCHAVE